MNKNFLLLYLLIVITSCTGNNEYCLEPHKSTHLTVNPSEQKMLNDSEYDIVDVVSLDLPESVSTIMAKDIQIVNGHIYILDTEVNKTVLMFGIDGAFINQLGKVGHARNEYISKPVSLSIDDKTGIAYVYERSSCRILKFNSRGEFLEQQKIDNNVPASFAVTEYGTYFWCFENGFDANGKDVSGTQLSLFNKEGNYIKSFLPSLNNSKLPFIGRPIYKDKEKISYVPFLADSILVFSNEQIDYTIKIDFCNQFVPHETVKKSMDDGTFAHIYQHKGVQFIDQFDLTDSIMHVGYAYNLSRSHFVKNLSNGKTYNTTLGPIFSGYCPVCDFFVANDKLCYLINEEDVDRLLLKNTEGDSYSDAEPFRKSSKQTMLDIMEKKFKFPLIMMVKLK